MGITITHIADELEQLVRHFNSLDSLSQASKEEAVGHARDILERLRFKKDDEESDEQLLDKDEANRKIAEDLLEVAKAFFGLVKWAIRNDPEKAIEKQISPVFEKTHDALGKATYKVRIEVINQLIKQGKAAEAAFMRAQLEVRTPEKFKAHSLPLSQLLEVMEEGLTQAELIEKRIAAGLQAQQWQNLPPPPLAPKKSELKDKLDIKDKIKAALFSEHHTVLVSQVSSVSEAALIPAAQQINDLPDPLIHHGVSYKVAAVSKEELVHPAKQVNEESEKQQDSARSLLNK